MPGSAPELGRPQVGRALWSIRRASATTSQCDLASQLLAEPQFPQPYTWAGVMLATCPSSSLSSPCFYHPPSLAAPRSIRCLRNIIHWNLISAFILRNATWFVVQLTMSPEVHQSNVVRPEGAGPGSEEGRRRARGQALWSIEQEWSLGGAPSCREEAQAEGRCCCCPHPCPGSSSSLMGVGLQGWCRLVTAAYNYFHVTNFFWMFGEGCYLHTAIVLTYSTDRLRKWMFICIGWGERASPLPWRGCPLLPHTQPSWLGT